MLGSLGWKGPHGTWALGSGERLHLRFSEAQTTGILVQKLLLWSPEGQDPFWAQSILLY